MQHENETSGALEDEKLELRGIAHTDNLDDEQNPEIPGIIDTRAALAEHHKDWLILNGLASNQLHDALFDGRLSPEKSAAALASLTRAGVVHLQFMLNELPESAREATRVDVSVKGVDYPMIEDSDMAGAREELKQIEGFIKGMKASGTRDYLLRLMTEIYQDMIAIEEEVANAETT